MARKLEVEIVGDAGSLNKALGQAGKTSSRFGQTVGRLGKAAAVGLGVASVAAGGLAAKMVGLASDAGEVDSKFKIVFGKTVPKLTKEMEAFSKATGVSRFEMKQQVADMGALLKPIVGSTQAAADMSLKMTQLATDLGSFNNVPTADALEAIRSGLVGQSEPMRRFGALINEAAVKTEAYRAGIAKQGAELTEAQKVQARYNLILKQTGLAHGDAERTSNSFANQMKRFKNTIADVGTEIGLKLIPAATNAIQTLSKFVGYIEDLTKLSPGKALRKIASDVKDAFSDLIFGKTTTWVLPLGDTAEVRTDGLIDKVRNAIDSIQWRQIGERIVRGIESGLRSVNWTKVGDAVVQGLAVALEASAKIAKAIVKVFDRAASSIDWNAFGSKMGPGLASAIVVAFATLLDPGFWAQHWEEMVAIGLAVFPVTKIASLIGKAFAAAFAPLGRLLGPALGSAFSAAVSFAETQILRVAELLGPKLGAAFLRAMEVAGKAFKELGKLAGAAVNEVGEQLGKLGGVITTKLGALKTFLVKAIAWDVLIRAIESAAKQAAAAAEELGRDIVKGVTDGVKGLVSAVRGFFQDVWAFIKGAAGSAHAFAFKIGAAIVTGIISGLGDLIGKIGGAIAGGVRGAIDWASKNIGSTAEEATSLKIGQPMARGVLQGWIFGTEQLPEKMSETLRNSIEKARAAVDEKRGLFSEAFSKLSGDALTAFDATIDTWVTRGPKQNLLDRFIARHDLEEFKARLSEAKQALADAQLGVNFQPAEGETPEQAAARVKSQQEAIAAAQKTVADLMYEQKRAALEREAAEENKQRSATAALKRRHFEEDLAELQKRLTNQGATHKEWHGAIIKLFNKFGVDYKMSGLVLGKSFAQGLRESEEAVVKAAKAIAAAAAPYLKLKSPAERGPLSDLDKWWQSFASTLLSGLDTRAISSAMSGAAPSFAGLGSRETPVPSLAGTSSFGATPITIHAPIYLDGRQIGEASYQYLLERGRSSGSLFSNSPGVRL